jgi:hypothetical protein
MSSASIPWHMETDPDLVPIRDDPRFKSLLTQLGKN